MADGAAHVAEIVGRDPSDLWQHISRERRRLLLAALETFSAVGFEAATTRKIAAGAGMSPAAVYVHYQAKVDLLQEIIEIAHDGVWSAITAAVDQQESASERLRAFAEAFAAWNASNYMLGRVAEYELRSLPSERLDKVLAVRRRIETFVRTEVKRGIEEEGFDVPDLRGMVLAVIALGSDVERWYSPARSIPIQKLAQLHGELILRMVRPWGAGD